jgi:hypothetical protein
VEKNQIASLAAQTKQFFCDQSSAFSKKQKKKLKLIQVTFFLSTKFVGRRYWSGTF